MANDTEQLRDEVKNLSSDVRDVVKGLAESTKIMGEYIVRHDNVSKIQDKIEARLDKMDDKQRYHSEAISRHEETHQDVKKVRNSILFSVVAVIVGLSGALVTCIGIMTTGA
jgi:hypothetical protein